AFQPEFCARARARARARVGILWSESRWLLLSAALEDEYEGALVGGWVLCVWGAALCGGFCRIAWCVL
ncbi:MAG: hypothetical protein ACKON9_18485, partial [Planctomycetaceae bacterium]